LNGPLGPERRVRLNIAVNEAINICAAVMTLLRRKAYDMVTHGRSRHCEVGLSGSPHLSPAAIHTRAISITRPPATRDTAWEYFGPARAISKTKEMMAERG